MEFYTVELQQFGEWRRELEITFIEGVGNGVGEMMECGIVYFEKLEDVVQVFCKIQFCRASRQLFFSGTNNFVELQFETFC